MVSVRSLFKPGSLCTVSVYFPTERLTVGVFVQVLKWSLLTGRAHGPCDILLDTQLRPRIRQRLLKRSRCASTLTTSATPSQSLLMWPHFTSKWHDLTQSALERPCGTQEFCLENITINVSCYKKLTSVPVSAMKCTIALTDCGCSRTPSPFKSMLTSAPSMMGLS